MDKKIKEIAKEVYTIGHKIGNCKGCPFENLEECNFVHCSGSATLESVTAQIEREYTKHKNFLKIIENYEIPVPVLDEIEKKYLTNVLRPFARKCDEIKIKKILSCSGDKEYLHVSFVGIGCGDCLDFPYFSKNTMYKNMELGKYYTLEELDLKF